jgi:hypothetical protein
VSCVDVAISILLALCFGNNTGTRQQTRVGGVQDNQDVHVEMGDDDAPAPAGTQLHEEENVGAASTAYGNTDTGAHQTTSHRPKKDPYSDLLSLGKTIARLAVEKGYEYNLVCDFRVRYFYLRACRFSLLLFSSNSPNFVVVYPHFLCPTFTITSCFAFKNRCAQPVQQLFRCLEAFLDEGDEIDIEQLEKEILDGARFANTSMGRKLSSAQSTADGPRVPARTGQPQINRCVELREPPSPSPPRTSQTLSCGVSSHLRSPLLTASACPRGRVNHK